MKFQTHNIVLSVLLLITSVSLVMWWQTQIDPIRNLNWKALPPDLPALPSFTPSPLIIGNQTLERPLFWESRRPLAAQAPQPTHTQTPTPLELLGIVSEGAQRVALLRPLQGTPPLLVRRLHLGETFNGMTIQSINTDQVTLDGSNGLQILKLKRGGQDTSQQPAKLSAPQTIETTRSQLPDDPRKHTDEAEKNAPAQTQPPPQ